MTCPNCGMLTRVGAGFCGECGFKLPIVYAAAPPPPPPPASSESAPAAPPPPPPPAVAPPAPPPPPAPPAPAPPPAPQAPPPPAPPAPPAPVVIAAPPAEVNPFIIGEPPGFSTPPVITPVAAEPIDDIGETRVSTRRKGASRWQLVMSDGQRQVLVGVALIGRDAAADARWPDATLIAVADSTKTVSKTHAVFEVDAAGLWVTDLQSSNGVFIELPDGQEVDVEPGIRTSVPVGSSVLLGDFAVAVDKA